MIHEVVMSAADLLTLTTDELANDSIVVVDTGTSGVNTEMPGVDETGVELE